MPGPIPPVVFEVRAKASEVFTEFGKVKAEAMKMANDTANSGTKTQQAFKTAAAAGGALALGAGGAAFAIGKYSLEAASASQVTEARLATAIKNAGGDAEKFKPQMENAANGMQKFGYTNNEAEQALANLTTALGSPKKAMSDLTIAANLAREKNISLADASMLVAKASEGQMRPLRSLGIDLPVYTGNAQQVALAQKGVAAAMDKANAILLKSPDAINPSSKAHAAYVAALAKSKQAQELLTQKQQAGDQMMSILASRVKGQAAAYGQTLKGQLDSANASFEAMGEKLGNMLIPIIEKVSAAGVRMMNFFSQHKGVLIAIIAVIGVLGGALAALYVIQKIHTMYTQIATTVEWLWNAAMSANPVMIIVLAIIALVVVIVLLITHWKQVTEFLTQVWQHVADFFVTIGNGISIWWQTLWNGIISFIVGVWTGFINWIISIIQFWVRVFFMEGQLLTTWWNDLWNFIVSLVTGVWNGVVSFITGAWNFIVRLFQVEAAILQAVWNAVWTFIVSVARNVWNGITSTISGAWNGIIGFFRSAGSTISDIWNNIWNGMASIVSGAFNGVVGAVRGAINGVISVVNGVIGTINGALSMGKAIGINVQIPKIPSLDTGGWTPGAKGQPTFAVIHGGEFMLSADMLAGRKPVPQDVQSLLAQNASAFNGGSSAGGGSGARPVEVTLNANTNASPGQITAALGWGLRLAG